jgi:hypothetical protein
MPSLSVYTEGRHYQDCLELYNSALKKEPLVCARPRTEEEVSRLVQFCTEKKIPFAVRSGGHDFFGRSVVHKGILIDMRDMDTVSIGSDRAHARVGGGVIAGHLQETLNSHGLFTPTGQAKSVGYVSWTCGGGYGFYVGTYGFGVDQILGARVVLAGGRVVDTDEDSELLWALRGAGAGTFGIVTELRVKVYPVPKLYAGFLAFPLAEAAAVMDRIERLLDGNFPDEFSGDAIAVNPEMAPTTVAEPCLVLFWCWTSPSGDLAPAKSFLEQTTQAGRVLGNTVTESKFLDFHHDMNSSSLLTCIQLYQLPTAWVIHLREPSSAVETLIGCITMLAPSSHGTLHRTRCPLLFFTITTVRVFATELPILSGRPFRIDTNMSFSASMGPPGQAVLMNRSLQVQPDGS